MDRVEYPIVENDLSVLFNKRTNEALDYYEQNCEQDYLTPLIYLYGCGYEKPSTTVCIGASYKQLARIGHLTGLDGKQRSQWYAVVEGLHLSHAHAGAIIEKIYDGQQHVEELEELLAQC